MTLEPADQEDDRLVSQKTHLTWVWMPGSFMDQIWGKVKKQSEKATYLANITQYGNPEDEMVGRHHRLDGHGFGWTPGVGDGQGGLACCSSWGHKESETTE